MLVPVWFHLIDVDEKQPGQQVSSTAGARIDGDVPAVDQSLTWSVWALAEGR